jgi:hypothetical protein
MDDMELELLTDNTKKCLADLAKLYGIDPAAALNLAVQNLWVGVMERKRWVRQIPRAGQEILSGQSND